MIHSTKESRAESLLRKIRASAKEINEAVEKLEKLSEEQQEIIRCKDCKHNGTHNCLLNLWATIFNSKPKDDFFCGMAERRTE